MPRISIDVSEAVSMEPVPDDTYEVVVSDVSDVNSGANSNYITVTLEISDGEFMGRKLFTNLPITGRGAGIFQNFWEKATGKLLEGEDIIEVDTDDLLGTKVSVVTKQEEYPAGSGDFRSQVKKVLRAN